jgi:3-phenylpropionate/cinnamic acid dioxygenase small subunit
MTATAGPTAAAPGAGAGFAAGFGLDRYERLARDVAGLRAIEWSDPEVLAAAVAFVHREARLLDDGRLEDWSALFGDDALYWQPANPAGGDPTREVSLVFDDRRRLDDRIYWLRTGLVTAQIPPSRTRHLLTNVEAVRGHEPGTLLVRANFALAEHRAGLDRVFTGWCGYVLVGAGSGSPDPAGLSVRTKAVFLTDGDRGHENLTFMF